jgi:hypothetical protein
LYRADSSIEIFGTSILQESGILYIYGFREEMQNSLAVRSMLIARVAPESLSVFSAWQFSLKGLWQGNALLAQPGVEIAPDYSVSQLATRTEYAAVYPDAGLSARILLRISRTPTGPWGDPQVIYQCPEALADPQVECYAARAHPELSLSANDLVVSYATNRVAGPLSPKLYFPRFIRVRFSN